MIPVRPSDYLTLLAEWAEKPHMQNKTMQNRTTLEMGNQEFSGSAAKDHPEI